MSIRSEVVAALGDVEVRNSSAWGQHARNLARGIEQSGVPALLGDINASLSTQTAVMTGLTDSLEEQTEVSRQTNSALLALAAANAAGFASVCSAIASTNQLLGSIENMLANPLSTRASERYRRGLRALAEEWYEPALKELDAAVEQDPFQAISHFARGLALGALGRREEALVAFSDAMTFTGKDDTLLPVLAGAAILAAQAAQQLNQSVTALTILARAEERIPNCAELILARAHLADDQAALERALRIAPELAIAAVAAQIQGAEVVAQRVALDPEGPIMSMRTAADAAKLFGVSVPIPASTPDAMTFHPVWRRRYEPQVRRAANAALDDLRQTQSSLRTAESAADKVLPADDSRGAKRRAATIWGSAWCVLLLLSVFAVASRSLWGILWVIFLVLITMPAYGAGREAANEAKSNTANIAIAMLRQRDARSAVQAANTKFQKAKVRGEPARTALASIPKTIPARLVPLTSP